MSPAQKIRLKALVMRLRTLAKSLAKSNPDASDVAYSLAAQFAELLRGKNA